MPLNDSAQIKYNDPAGGVASDFGPQINTHVYHRKALIEAAKDRYFSPLASVTDMPKHYGKKIKKYHILPLLDDRNINDQGIDAAGATTVNGNLYGSSKDIGAITAKIPLISETGGRVNRVGYTRIELESTLENMGIFHEFTQDSLDFDTMDDLYETFSRELIQGATEITEDMLQIDLINGAGVIRFGGVATQNSEVTGEGANLSLLTFSDLQRMSIDLDNNRTPKQTKMIKGSTMQDTVTVGGGRLLYVGSEMIPSITKMTDHFGKQAFVSLEHYAYAGDFKAGVNMIHGEIGKVGDFRIIVVPEMLKWAGAGATETVANAGYQATGSKYDVFPLLCVGAESFTTIGFQTSGKTYKFVIRGKMPAETIDRNDPYGKVGFRSIQWWYSTMILRNERIALGKSVAEL